MKIIGEIKKTKKNKDMKQYILPISILGSFVLGAVICKTVRYLSHPRISVINIDWDKLTFDYSVNGGSFYKIEIGKDFGEGNIGGKFGLSSVVSTVTGDKYGYILSVVNNENGRSSTAFLNTVDKTVVYS